MSVTAIILAAGAGERFGSVQPKQFTPLLGRPALAHAVEAFTRAPSIERIIVVAAEEYLAYVSEEVLAGATGRTMITVVAGGATRAESTRKALAKVGKDSELVAIHDGARAAIRVDDIEAVIAAARDSGAAILGRAVSDTVKRIDRERVVETVDRRRLFRAETPQVFSRDLIVRAHEHFEGEPTDDAQAVEALGRAVSVVHAAHANIKLTRPEDVPLMEALLAQKQ